MQRVPVLAAFMNDLVEYLLVAGRSQQERTERQLE